MKLGVAAVVVGDDIVSGDVEITEGVISGVGLEPPVGSEIAVPGFIDLHVHGHGGVDFVDATVDDHRSIARALPKTGVTTYLPTLMSMPIERTITAMHNHPGAVEGGARVGGFHLEGPFLSPSKPGPYP